MNDRTEAKICVWLVSVQKTLLKRAENIYSPLSLAVSFERRLCLIKDHLLLIFLIIGNFFFSTSCLWAQTKINSTQFIQEKLTNTDIFTSVSSANASFKTTLIEEVEIRTETKDFDFNRQSYTIRVRPNSRKNRSAQIQLFRQLGEDAKLERQVYVNDFIELAYEDWLYIYDLNCKLAENKTQLIIYKDIERVLLKLGQIESLKVKDLLEVQSDITSTTISIQSLEVSLLDNLNTEQADFSDLITIEDIQNFFLLEANQSISLLSSTKRKVLKEATIESEIALELANQKRWLDFVQVQYQGPHTDGLQERISIGAGINIPFSSSSQLKMEELKMEKTLIHEEYEIEQALNREKFNRKRQVIKELIGEYFVTKNLVEQQKEQAEKLVAKVKQEEGTSPLLELYHKIEYSKQQLGILKLEVTIYEEYIDYLALTEKLFTQPFHNFLVND